MDENLPIDRVRPGELNGALGLARKRVKLRFFPGPVFEKPKKIFSFFHEIRKSGENGVRFDRQTKSSDQNDREDNSDAMEPLSVNENPQKHLSNKKNGVRKNDQQRGGWGEATGNILGTPLRHPRPSKYTPATLDRAPGIP